jgi:hypothetical protein
MKKIMSLMLGLSLILGTAAAFAEDKPADSTKSTKKSKKKSTTKKKTTTPETEKKS